MKRNNRDKFLSALIMFVLSTVLVLVGSLSAQAQKTRAAMNSTPAVPQQPLYTEYKGVRLGMTVDEARSKLGKTTFLDKEMAYFVLSEAETAQLGFDQQGKIKTISIDYQNGAGAPDPKAVVGAALETKENGSQFRVVYYESQGFSVSYSRTAGPVIIVTITISKM